MTILNETNPPINELVHYGVKGMKWGRRKTRPTTAQIKRARAFRKDVLKKIDVVDKKVGRNPETGKIRYTKEQARLYKSIDPDSPARIAHLKTRGEKIAFAILAGPIGAYYASDLNVKNRI